MRSREDARRVVSILNKFKDRVHSWDTETIAIDAKEESPVGNGKVLCASVFIGPDIDFGSGPRVFIDNYADAENIIMEFKEYFENPNILKCWHNYGFDRHILYNHGINVQGFGGDTMHMARLVDPSLTPNSYALSALSELYENDIKKIRKTIIDNMKNETLPDPDLEAKRL